MLLDVARRITGAACRRPDKTEQSGAESITTMALAALATARAILFTGEEQLSSKTPFAMLKRRQPGYLSHNLERYVRLDLVRSNPDRRTHATLP